MLFQPGHNVSNVVAGVDYDRLVRGLVAQDGAIALQRSYREGLKNHASILEEGYFEAGLAGAVVVVLIPERTEWEPLLR